MKDEILVGRSGESNLGLSGILFQYTTSNHYKYKIRRSVNPCFDAPIQYDDKYEMVLDLRSMVFGSDIAYKSVLASILINITHY